MLSHRELGLNDSRTIAPDENCPFPNPKLTLSQPLTLAGEQLCSGALVWLSLNPKANPNIDPNPNPIGEGAIFLGGEGGGRIVRIPVYTKLLYCFLLITDYDITRKLTIKEKITSQMLCLSI